MSDCNHAIAYSTLYYDGVNGYLVLEDDQLGISGLMDEDIVDDCELKCRKRFAFCPMCGERIDWDVVSAKERLREL